MRKPENCEHHHFHARVDVNRIIDIGKFVADIKIECSECKTPFEFIGVPAGHSYAGPRTSIDFCQLSAPIQPFAGKLAARSVFEAYDPAVRPTDA